MSISYVKFRKIWRINPLSWCFQNLFRRNFILFAADREVDTTLVLRILNDWYFILSSFKFVIKYNTNRIRWQQQLIDSLEQKYAYVTGLEHCHVSLARHLVQRMQSRRLTLTENIQHNFTCGLRTLLASLGNQDLCLLHWTYMLQLTIGSQPEL